MAEKLPKKYRKALRGDLDVKRRKVAFPASAGFPALSSKDRLTTFRNSNIPKWDYSSGGYTRSIDEQSAYMKEKAQKKADKKFKEEAGFGDYALELGGYASAAYLYFKLPKIGGLAGKGIRGIGKLNKMRKKPPLFDTTRMPKTQRLFHLENLTSNFKKGPGTKKQKSYVIRSLLTGPGADKLEKDILKEGKPTATEKVFLKGKHKMREFKQKGEIITKKEIKSKGKTKLLKEQNRGFGNMTRIIKTKSNMPEVQKKMIGIRERERGKLINKSVKETGGKLPQFRSKSLQTLLRNQQSTVRQEKAAGKLGTKLRNLISNLRSKPRAYK